MRFFIAFCVVLAVKAADQDEWRTVLHKIALIAGDTVNKSDNYICVQDLSRFYYTQVKPEQACTQPATLPTVPLRVQDRLKLDVAVSKGAEIYSWHGARQFSSPTVGQLVHEGPISSGSFNGYLRNVFGERGVTFSYHGIRKEKDFQLFQFDYDVPLSASHYQVQSGKSFELAPFYGSFTARTDTFELYSLSVIAHGESLTPQTNICAAQTRLFYQAIKIADHEALLPASFDLLMGSRNGIFTDSKGVYSGCREYKGESTVSFDVDESGNSTAKAEELQAQPLIAGLVLPISLKTDIDEDTAYAGLPLEATLQRDVKIQKGVKLTRGSTLHGTLTEFEIFREPEHIVILKLDFNSINDGNKLYLCHATYHAVPTFGPPYSAGGGRRSGSFGQRSLPNSAPDDTLRFSVSHLHLSHNYTSELITVSQTPEP